MVFHSNMWKKLREQSQPFQEEYRPLFFRLNLEEDQVKCNQLLESRPSLLIYDRFQDQLGELIKSRAPSRRYSDTDLKQEIRDWLGDRPPERYGVWVYYSWSQRLVHLLDEPEFRELRTVRNLYKITLAERDLLAQKKIGIIGLSVGQSLALTMAMERSFGEIRLADFDQLELSNLNRIRGGVHNLGVSKVILAAREIAEIDPFLHVTCFCQGLDEKNLDQFLLEGGKLDVLVDECDSLDMKLFARYRARSLRIPVVMDTSDRGLLDVERFDLEPDRPVLHGLIPDLDPDKLKSLTNEDKIPYLLTMLGVETLSTRIKASAVEVGQSISTWPQLASSVLLGGAVGADVCRRIALGHYHESGRYFVDLEELIGDKKPSQEIAQHLSAPSFSYAQEENLSKDQMLCLIDTLTPAQTTGRVVLERQHIIKLVEAAICAPSGGNNQPWKWIYRHGTLFLFHDRQRSASLLDYEHNASFIALGATCENVALQAQALELEARICSFPLEHEIRLVAAIDFVSHTQSRQTEPYPYEKLVRAIPLRHVNRKGGTRRPLPPGALSQISAAVQSIQGAGFCALEGEDELREIGEILGAAERLRLLYQQSHDEMMHEIRWSKSEAERSRDGLDLDTLELLPSEQAVLRMCRDWSVLSLVQQWKGGRALERTTRRSVEAASCIALITMPGHRPDDYFYGGRAVQRAWLTSTLLNVAFQPLTSLIYLFARLIRGNGVNLSEAMIGELRELRDRYSKLFAVNDSQGEIFLFRLAIADAPSAISLRRPVTDVLSFYE